MDYQCHLVATLSIAHHIKGLSCQFKLSSLSKGQDENFFAVMASGSHETVFTLASMVGQISADLTLLVESAPRT